MSRKLIETLVFEIRAKKHHLLFSCTYVYRVSLYNCLTTLLFELSIHALDKKMFRVKVCVGYVTDSILLRTWTYAT